MDTKFGTHTHGGYTCGVQAGREGQGEGYTSNGTTRTMVCIVLSLLYLSGWAWDAQGHRDCHDCCVWRTRTRMCKGIAISVVMSMLSQSSPEVGEDKAWAVAVAAVSSGRGRGRQQGCAVVVASLSLSRHRGASPILA